MKDKWYAMGLVWASGYITDGRLWVSNNSREVIERAAEYIAPGKKIYQTGSNYKFSTSQYDEVLEEGFVQRCVLEVPEVPKEYIIDFIKGYFGGRGNFVLEVEEGRKRWVTNIYAPNLTLMEQILEMLAVLGMPESKILRKRDSYLIRYYAHATEKLKGILGVD